MTSNKRPLRNTITLRPAKVPEESAASEGGDGNDPGELSQSHRSDGCGDLGIRAASFVLFAARTNTCHVLTFDDGPARAYTPAILNLRFTEVRGGLRFASTGLSTHGGSFPRGAVNRTLIGLRRANLVACREDLDDHRNLRVVPSLWYSCSAVPGLEHVRKLLPSPGQS